MSQQSEFYVIWKIVRQVQKFSAFRTLCKIVEIKIGGKTGFDNLLKQLFHSSLLDMSDYNQLALRARWLFYHFISNLGSWNNCYIFPNFENCASCEKDLKDNKASSLDLERKCSDICPWTLFVPRSSQFSESEARRKL